MYLFVNKRMSFDNPACVPFTNGLAGNNIFYGQI